MIHFPILRTRRLTVQLRELSLGASIAIAAMPGAREEACCTAFLRHALVSAQGVDDPAQWTVQERMLAVCHYLAAVSDDGPDFSLGNGRYSDYLDGAADLVLPLPAVDVGEIGGDRWSIRHLTGAMAESVERLEGEVENVSGRLHWLLGGMAAQMIRAGETVPDTSEGEGAFDEFLLARMRVFAGYPESEFTELLHRYGTGRERLHHLFRVEFAGDGLVALPKGGAASDLPPARFPVRAGLSELTRNLVGKPHQSGRQSHPIFTHAVE